MKGTSPPGARDEREAAAWVRGMFARAARRYDAANLLARLVHDKKTRRGKVHFVLPVRIGEVAVVSGIDERLVLESIRSALA